MWEEHGWSKEEEAAFEGVGLPRPIDPLLWWIAMLLLLPLLLALAGVI